MEPETAPSSLVYLPQRFQLLVWSCIDADLTRSAVFFAERYFALNQQSHDARHLYATALLREGQPYSALSLVNLPREKQCSGCLELKAKCATTLGRFRQAHEALEECMRDPTYTASSSASPRSAKLFPDEASLLCRAGNLALKGNLPEQALSNFRQALSLTKLNPFLWEAFEGLCALGAVQDIDHLLPPRPVPVRRSTVEESQVKQISPQTGSFFTPETQLSWRPDANQPQPFRMGPPALARESAFMNDTSLFSADDTFQQTGHRSTRSQPTIISGPNHPHISRPLSSADETGPVTKKLRSAARQPDTLRSSKLSKLSGDDPLKKARARSALTFANSSHVQPTTSRSSTLAGKSNAASTSNPTIRRSSRLVPGVKQTTKSRDRRRPLAHGRSLSIDSEMDEDTGAFGEVAYSPSPPSNAQSPRSDRSPSPSNLNSPAELAAQEAYDIELADNYIYDLMRRFACATKALATYDSRACLAELEKLPQVHQQTAWVLGMIGRAHYELSDYTAADRAFKHLRTLEPYRLWDMEVYSTLLWHLQRNVELSFLAQELLNIDPRSAQAWIAVGNLFSLQKERSQALTCFRRAGQLDPSCAYAYTLSGHETIDEDLDKAINFFQSALRVDARHYNAWYGLGTCYLRMSKIRLAEYHYRKAVEIHPHNAVLLGCVGMAVERRGERATALSLFDDAVRISPDNALVRYRRAKILIAMKHYDLAIKDLEFLRSSTPEESNVIFQLARVYRLVGNDSEFTKVLAIARDISPKSINKIKKLLDTVKDETVDDKMDEG
ncbi:hypothetical protein C8J56DRAFT_865104 [Mycena floridula]|nr:hypothetical protein C8J56DRAFT_865104 [Mycena floridula]